MADSFDVYQQIREAEARFAKAIAAKDYAGAKEIDQYRTELTNFAQTHPQNYASTDWWKTEAALAHGVPFKDVSAEPTGLLGRADIGLSDKPDERLEKAKAYLPEGTEFRQIAGPTPKTQPLMSFRTPENKVGFLNPPGFEAGDVAQFATSEGPEMAAGIAASIAFPGAQFLAPAVAAGAAYAGKEGVETLRGYQQSSPWEVAGKTALTGLVEGLANRVVGKGIQHSIEKPTNLLSGRGLITGQKRGDLIDIERMRRGVSSEPYVPLRRDQMATGQFSKTVGGQAHATDPAMSIRDQAQQEYMARVAQTSQMGDRPLPKDTDEALKAIGQSRYDTGIEMQDAAENILRRRIAEGTRTGRGGGVTDNTLSGVNLTRSTQEYIDKTKSQVNSLYDDVRRFADEEAPVYDLTPAKQAIDDLEVPAIAGYDEVFSNILDKSGKPVTAGFIGRQLNVLPPAGKVAVVTKMLKELEPTQFSYEALKVLRTQVGEAIEKAPWDANMNSGMAKVLYRTLSDIIENPVSDAPKTVAAHKIASRAAKDYYDRITDDTFQFVHGLNTHPAKVANAFASDPTLLNAGFRSTLQKLPAKRLDDFYKFVRQDILTSPNGAEASMDLWKRQNPAEFRRMIGNERQFRLIAQQIDDSNARLDNLSSHLNNALDAGGRSLNLMATDRRATTAFVNGMTDGQKRTARIAVMDELLADAIKTNESGGLFVNTKALKAAYDKAAQKGWTDIILTNQDRERVKGLIAYSKFAKSKIDSGSSLEIAQAYTELKHPASFLSGLHKIGVNRAIAAILLAPKQGGAWRKIMLGNLKEPMRFDRLRLAGHAATHIAEYANTVDFIGAGKEQAQRGIEVGERILEKYSD